MKRNEGGTDDDLVSSPTDPTRNTPASRGVSAPAPGGPALASTGESLQDLAAVLPALPDARGDVAKKVTPLEPGGDGADALAVMGDRILCSGPRAAVRGGKPDRDGLLQHERAWPGRGSGMGRQPL
jgi:hypothetical protein